MSNICINGVETTLANNESLIVSYSKEDDLLMIQTGDGYETELSPEVLEVSLECWKALQKANKDI